MTAPATADAPALATALGALGIFCRVESRGGLALIATGAASAAGLAVPASRREVLALAQQHGFTHVAVELTADPAGAGAPVLRD